MLEEPTRESPSLLWTQPRVAAPPCDHGAVYATFLAGESYAKGAVIRYVVKPATRRASCSYVELVSRGPQQPSWVVLHWCGMPFGELWT